MLHFHKLEVSTWFKPVLLGFAIYVLLTLKDMIVNIDYVQIIDFAHN